MKIKFILIALICAVFCNPVAAQNDEIQKAKQEYQNGSKKWKPAYYGDHYSWKLLDEAKVDDKAVSQETVDTIVTTSRLVDCEANNVIKLFCRKSYKNGDNFLKQRPVTIHEVLDLQKKILHEKIPVAYGVFEKDDINMANISHWPSDYALNNAEGVVDEVAKIIKKENIKSLDDLVTQSTASFRFTWGFADDKTNVWFDLQTEEKEGITTIYLVAIKPIVAISKKTFREAKQRAKEI